MRHADRPTIEEEIFVAAAPERIWPLVSDIALPVDPSTELQSVEWESGADPEPAVGRRFVGTNRNKHFGEWQTTSTVTECDEPFTFAWAVGDLDEPNTAWRFTLRPEGDGTVVVQWAQLGFGDSGLHVAIKTLPDKEERIVERRLEEFRAGMRANLEAIKQAAEAG
ncbi:MAG: SRPBCC family protein [Actinomycetota bacterium]|nr:SRPBCC family protein [Actinomycetota bacterium]